MTEKEIEIQMKKSINKISYEIKKIKFLLFLLKFLKKVKYIFGFRRYF